MDYEHAAVDNHLQVAIQYLNNHFYFLFSAQTKKQQLKRQNDNKRRTLQRSLSEIVNSSHYHQTSGLREYPSILMGLFRSERKIRANKQEYQGLICGERKGKGCIGNAVPRARKKGLEDICISGLRLLFSMAQV